ncbi:MAG TPA: sulfur carrier protein ThiS [Leptospiraceae bacterium]|nr:sulfur carrier protein ThiS [Leptospiraceae bacterium]HMW07413.1 sulfur carrier protein ThiS [Leptospiraceae bacterium]HMX34693.1 sulfur carrier protein ThiS [Leptospiraceae bacterium]HMY32992.1 sulfur carrier protein ThiS [Leptospiraceae bacterium]HMZ63550.1 sulfur carrier protein ThiS [Leptospiraceae bacterium]
MKVNGKQVDISGNSFTISEYLTSIRLNPNTIAIEWNGEILEREKWQSTYIKDSDTLEIIKFVGGG